MDRLGRGRRTGRCGLCLRGSGGIHVNIRLDEHKLCLLIMIGVRVDGRKELAALTDGYGESTESWADLASAEPGWRYRLAWPFSL
jgi:hypothetical protein